MNTPWLANYSALGALLWGCNNGAHPPTEHVMSPEKRATLLDHRQALPLLPHMAVHQKQSMREHLEAVSEVIRAYALGDFAALEAGAKRLGSSERMGQMCDHMGSAAPGFTQQALDFHARADRIVDAARASDSAATLHALTETLQACTACHATWKQEVVDEAAFQALAARGR